MTNFASLHDPADEDNADEDNNVPNPHENTGPPTDLRHRESRSPDSRDKETGRRRLRRNVSGIVVTYWTGPIIEESIEGLLGQSVVSEVIVVNNGNPDSTAKWLNELAAVEPRIRILTPGKNIGFAAGCNLGVSNAASDYIALVNPDCVTSPESLARILDVFEARSDAWVCGARLKNPDGTEQRGGRREILSPWRAFAELMRFDRWFPDHPYFRRLHRYEDEAIDTVLEVPTVSGACMIFPKRIYERVGGMDDNMFLHFEDADICIRIIHSGGKCLYCGNVQVTHHLSTSDVSRMFVEWHKTRSTNYYFRKHFYESYPSWCLILVSVFLWIRYLIILPKIFFRDLPGFLRRWRRI